MAKYTSIGGQALIEGIMMKSPEKTAMAVRMPNGEIDVTKSKTKSIKQKYKILGIPIVRGVVGFIESMTEGYKAMMTSAEKSGFTDLEEDGKEQTEKDKKKTNIFVTVAMVVGSVLGVALAVALFMFLPWVCVKGIEKLFEITLSNIAKSAIEQFIKLSVFVLYMFAISFMKDIKRVFMYHGAEHKTIFCYEKGLELTVENVRLQSRFHPRCGTSFMILMILISIVFSTVAQILLDGVYDNALFWILIKIALIPVICGVGYEVLKFCGRYDNFLTKIISAPGLWMQRISTKEPDDDMIEIAIAALRACEPETPDVNRDIDKKEIEDTEKGTENDDI
ncbi:MAG: DUF1385 domain-containing protein [Clostridia bacterium]|nr:DUF1385 domain-containing protein [Clostridia bacterium]